MSGLWNNGYGGGYGGRGGDQSMMYMLSSCVLSVCCVCAALAIAYFAGWTCSFGYGNNCPGASDASLAGTGEPSGGDGGGDYNLSLCNVNVPSSVVVRDRNDPRPTLAPSACLGVPSVVGRDCALWRADQVYVGGRQQPYYDWFRVGMDPSGQAAQQSAQFDGDCQSKGRAAVKCSSGLKVSGNNPRSGTTWASSCSANTKSILAGTGKNPQPASVEKTFVVSGAEFTKYINAINKAKKSHFVVGKVTQKGTSRQDYIIKNLRVWTNMKYADIKAIVIKT